MTTSTRILLVTAIAGCAWLAQVIDARAATIGGRVVMGDGSALTPRFSIRALGPTTVTRALDQYGFFSLETLPIGKHDISLIAPGGATLEVLSTVTLDLASQVLNVGELAVSGSWFRTQLTQPDGAAALTDDLTYQVLCKTKSYRIQSYGGVLIHPVPPNEACAIVYYRGSLTGPYVVPAKLSFTSLASGTKNPGALRTRTPSISGSVRDRTGATVPNTKVTLTPYPNDGKRSTASSTTNASGLYTFTITPGRYTLAVANPNNPSTQGYGIPWQDVSIPAQGSTTVDVTLHEANILGQIVNREGFDVTRDTSFLIENQTTKQVVYLRPISGSFVTYVPPGTYAIEVTAADYYTARRNFAVVNETATELQFQTGWAVTTFTASGTKPDVRLQVKNTNTKATTKNTVGLNVHWSSTNERFDESVFAILQETNTKWVREWFKASTFPNTRYHFTIQRYRDLGINVVGMLAYNPAPFDRVTANLQALTAWKSYVRKVVKTYKSHIRVWEVWNEPNFIHLKPPTVGAYLPYLKAAGEIIREEDPQAIILNGGLSWPDAKWMEALLRSNTGKKYVDQVAFHIYYCDMYAKYGDNRRLKADLAKFKKVFDKYRKGQKAWVTEMGCSLKTKGITETKRLKYAKETVPWLLKQNWIQNILWYTTLDSVGSDPYENFFGLYTYPALKPRSIATWYKNIKP